ncbi:MAG TPA: ABC transporter substrate-binding protein [Cyclobacteriaceae bacterium]|nr:ABC transporter substrate-binding protein [Cyclobacteriaceae bacterium]
MMIRKSIFIFLVLISCSKKKQPDEANHTQRTTLQLKYAEGFKAHYEDNNIWISVTRPYQNADKTFKYLLVKRGNPVPEHDEETQLVYIPIEKIVCTSTTHIPLLDYLDESEKLIGFPTTDYISSEKTRELVDKGKVVDLGIDQSLNIELLLSIQPDVVMAYTISGNLGHYKKINESGIPVVINAEYMETHPLGRAEWIKFAALFFGKEAEAEAVFNEIEKTYLQAQSLTAYFEHKPTIMSGVLYGDSWFVPSGQNNAAILLADAGLHYLWSDLPGTGFSPLSFEEVFSKAHEADYWIGASDYKSLSDMLKADRRYEWFKAFKTKQVYTYTNSIGAKGGNEYLELGYLRPDIILKDLIKITSPQSIPEHDLYFFKQLH